MITYYKRKIKDKKIKKLKGFETGCWIKVVNPTKEEIKFLVDRFKLDEQNLVSGLDENEVPRVEFDNNNIYIFVKTISDKGQQFLNTCLILISDKFILTLSSEEPKFIKDYYKLITTQKFKVLIKFLLNISEGFEKETLKIVKIVNKVKNTAKEMKEKDLIILLQQEDKLNYLIFSYQYLILIYEKLLKTIEFFKEDREIMEDLVISSTQGLNMCKSSLKTISNIRNYQTIMLSNKINKTMAILTIFMAFLGISTTITGFYGMNVKLPFQNIPNIYAYIILSILISGFILFFYLLRTKI
ncbi:MAG: hypothetical protein B6U88_02015 [Candidatus Aenigmarchaeota archaeon ex4484_56]|nr:MAG: hypothetical protein B6U88_02015 [Candidatus Aenigmarchaeota archaeon ex4484_56]